MRQCAWLLACSIVMACGEDTEPHEDASAREDASVEGELDASPSKPAASSKDAARPTVDAGSAPDDDASSPADARVDAGTSQDAGAQGMIAAALDGLSLEAPCKSDTPLPLANGATCMHAGTSQHLSRVVSIGGDSARVYTLRLRVRGIWEPTWIVDGTRPDDKLPLTVGGNVASGEPTNYQQWFVRVDQPKRTYWLNDYRYTAHDIHREDYTAEIEVNGKSRVTVGMDDGNDHQIANFPREVFTELADGGMPSTGQLLRIDVLKVSER